MIVITTPTGGIGRQVLQNLLDTESRIRVIVRDPSRLTPEARDRVKVVRGSHDEPAVVNAAFKDADAVFWLVPPNPRAETLEAAYSGFSKAACAAVVNQGVKRVVSVSALGRGTRFAGSAGLVTASLEMDDLIAGTGVQFRALAMPSFMENLLRQVESIRNNGVFFSPDRGRSQAPYLRTRDIAAVASRLLQDSTWTGQKSVPVLGPEDLSFNDMAQIMSETLNRSIRYVQTPFEVFESRLRDAGMSEAFTTGYVEMMKAKNEGMDNAVPRTPEPTTPTTFRQWCEKV